MLNLHETLTSTSSHVLLSRAFGLFYTLIQNRGKWVSLCPHEELHRGTLCRPSLTVEQSQAFALNLMLMKLSDAVIDEGGWSLFVQNCHLDFFFLYI